MSTLETVNARSKPRHGHKANGADPATERCPWCGSPINRTEFERIKNQIAEQERARVAKAERAAAATVAKVKEDMARREAAIRKQAADSATEALKATFETTLKRQLDAQAEASEKRLNAAVAAEREKAFGDRMKVEQQLKDALRANDRLPAFELGEPAEINLADSIIGFFSEEDVRVSRVPKGKRGPDVIVDIMSSGVHIGRVVIDSKNHKTWQNKFCSKLKTDQIAYDAEFAILSTATFPRGARQIHMQDGVLVCDPARVPVILDILRSHIVHLHTLRQSADSRAEKADALMAFVLSPAYADMLDRLLKRLAELDALHAEEVKAHKRTWEKRTTHIEVVRAVIGEFAAAVAAIIAGETR